MSPLEITLIGQELAVRWSDASESFIPLEVLRRSCPCASCAGETDILGNTYRSPPRPYSVQAFTLVRWDRVGLYGLQPIWADGHSTGIYNWPTLERLGQGGNELTGSENAAS